MAIIKFENGIRVRFNGNPNQTDIEEMALNLGIGNNNQKQFQDVKSTSDAFFPSNKNDNPLIAGAKAIGNLPKSIYEFGKGIVSAVSHPIQTVKTVGNILGQGGEKVLENTVGKGIEAITGQEIQKQDTPEFDAFANSRSSSVSQRRSIDFPAPTLPAPRNAFAIQWKATRILQPNRRAQNS